MANIVNCDHGDRKESHVSQQLENSHMTTDGVNSHKKSMLWKASLTKQVHHSFVAAYWHQAHQFC